MTQSAFLTAEEMIELTGRKRPAHQIAWLSKTGWIYQTNAAGRPVISRDYALAKLGGAQALQPLVSAMPNFGALA